MNYLSRDLFIHFHPDSAPPFLSFRLRIYIEVRGLGGSYDSVITDNNMFYLPFVAKVGLEPTRSSLTRKFSYHTCFYTSNLNAFYYAIHFIGAGVGHLLFKILWSGLFHYHIRNLASKYIRFNLTSNSSLLFLFLRILLV